MELYLLWLVITWLASSNGLALGETCWRNTPCDEVKDSSFPGEWESNIFAPASRTVTPSAAFDLGTHKRLSSWPEGAILQGSQKGVYFDFGSEVGGIITIEFEVLSVTHKGTIALAFAEARDWIGPVSDSSSGNYGREDGALRHSFFAPGKHTYVVPDKKLRGGFRYMTLVVQGNGASIRVKNVSLEISFQPTWSNLRAYRGYFHSSDDLLNKIWYSCAYTLQLSAVHPETGRAWPSPGKEWHNNGNIGPGHTINIDGAKRDRTVWPGDMGVAIPASAYSTGDVESAFFLHEAHT
ncbi:hypothetical protein MGN70_000890 [Eutypa lata]|nr:hypothetical protein MGN70_000890 [Eutypa lata]